MFALASHYARQQAWSLQTFGPGWRPGVIAHIVEELEEVLQEPNDLEEWTDITILAFDGMWRGTGLTPEHLADTYGEFPNVARPVTNVDACLGAIRAQLTIVQKDPADTLAWSLIIDTATDGMRLAGANDEAIISALVAKQTKNEGRQWPDWRTMPVDASINHVRGAAE